MNIKNIFHDQTFRLLLILSVLVSIETIFLFSYYFDFSYFEQDAISYLFQSRLFADGKIMINVDNPGFLPSEHINFQNNIAYSKYPFVNSLMLLPGVLIGLPWIIPAILTGMTVFIISWTIKERFGKVAAIATALLCLISPAVNCLGATFFSEVTSRFFLALFIFFFNRSFMFKSWKYPFLSGLMLGVSFNCRPLTCLVFAFCTSTLFLIALLTKENRKQELLRNIPFIPGFLIMLIFTFCWNAYFTGHPLHFPFSVGQTYDKLGFGKRGMGKNMNPEDLPSHTPQIAFTRLYKNTIPCLAYNTFGWGNYFPEIENRTTSEAGILIGNTVKTEAFVYSLMFNHEGKLFFQIKNTQPGSTVLREKEFPTPSSPNVLIKLIREKGKIFIEYCVGAKDKWERICELDDSIITPCVLGIFHKGQKPIIFKNLNLNLESGKVIQKNMQIPLDNNWKQSQSADGNTFFASCNQKDKFNSIQFELELPSVKEKVNWLNFFPVLLISTLIFLAFKKKENVPCLLFLLSLVLVNITAYCFYFFDGSTMDYTPVASRYHNEVTTLALIPLCALGLVYVFETFNSWKIRPAISRIAKITFAIIAIMLLINTLLTYKKFALHLRNWNDICQMLPKFVKQQKIENSVVFVNNPICAPLGEYPFVPMEKASIIYFRLGKFPGYGLEEDDWKKVFNKYFSSRKAYIYHKGKLIRVR